MCLLSAAASVTGGDGAMEEQQQQLLQSIHSMIGDLEAEKRSYLGMLDSSQVCHCPLPYDPLQSDGCSLIADVCWGRKGEQRGGGGGLHHYFPAFVLYRPWLRTHTLTA